MPQNPDAIEDRSESGLVEEAAKSAVKPSPVSERLPYTALTPEEKRSVLLSFKRFLNQGDIDPILKPFLLGLDWDFSLRKFPASYDLTSYFNPPEFRAIAFSALDAYAVTILAAPLPFETLGALELSCSLKRENASSPMHLEFRTTAQRGCLEAPTHAEAVVASFAEALRVRGITKEPTLYTEAKDYFVELAYPGAMIADVSPYLRNRPVDLWPRATLHLLPTEELCRSARQLVMLLKLPPLGVGPH